MRYLVLERDSQLIGFACLIFTRPPAWSDSSDKTRLPQVVDIQIEQTLRGQGYGTFLLQSLESIAAECGVEKLYLAVDPLGNPRAHALYLRSGYRPLQAGPHRVHWEFVDSEGNQYMGDGWSVDIVKSL
jgi:GNAT superfamily N-acetyltransferase